VAIGLSFQMIIRHKTGQQNKSGGMRSSRQRKRREKNGKPGYACIYFLVASIHTNCAKPKPGESKAKLGVHVNVEIVFLI